MSHVVDQDFQEIQKKPGGNTKRKRTPGTIPVSQCYRWQWTLKADVTKPNEPKEVWESLMPFCKELYFQLEEGEGGYHHYQGCLSLKNKEYMHTVKNMIRSDIHLEPSRDWQALKKYSTKHASRIWGPWTHNTVWVNTFRSPYPWQEEIIEYIQRVDMWDDRTIVWICDYKGNNGKTVLCKYLALELNCLVLGNGAARDIAHCLGDRQPDTVVFNFTRAVEGRINYGAIEAIKDGLIFSPKYESHMKIFNCPKVIVMSNFMPDLSEMSKDRWVIGIFDDNNNLLWDV